MTDLIKIMPFTPYAEKLTRYFDRMAPAIHELLTTEEFGGSPKFIARCDAEFETWRHVGRAPTREAYGTAFDGWTRSGAYSPVLDVGSEPTGGFWADPLRAARISGRLFIEDQQYRPMIEQIPDLAACVPAPRSPFTAYHIVKSKDGLNRVAGIRL